MSNPGEDVREALRERDSEKALAQNLPETLRTPEENAERQREFGNLLRGLNRTKRRRPWK